MRTLELSGDLDDLVQGTARPIQLRELLLRLGDRSFGLVLIVLAVPSALPIPAPGYSTPLGVLIFLIALQMIVGRQRIWLPERVLRWQFSSAVAQKALRGLIKSLRIFEKFLRPRYTWICAGLGIRLFGLLAASLAVLMCVPLPLTNTLPALVIFVVGLSLTEDDGILAVLAAGAGVLVVTFYITGFILILALGLEGFDHFIEWLKHQA